MKFFVFLSLDQIIRLTIHLFLGGDSCEVFCLSLSRPNHPFNDSFIFRRRLL